MIKKKPLIAITMGDPGGIGPEIILKVCREIGVYAFCKPVIVGDSDVLTYYKRCLKQDIGIVRISDITSPITPSPTELYVLEIPEACNKIVKGEATYEGGKIAAMCIERGVSLVMDGKVDAITTAPINKKGLNMAGYHYAGHTEMIADLTGTRDVAMMLTSGEIRVVLATTHTPLREVSSLLSISRIEGVLEIINNSMHYFRIEMPRIAVTSLNPHGGEEGIFGCEEEDIIIPAINNVRERGIDVAGPFPADTLFVYENRERFDVILTMYHDQGLIPLKMVAFGRAVNVTLGLPIIRTSVDHGTAYDIVGKDIADPSSMKEALKLASSMVLNKRLKQR